MRRGWDAQLPKPLALKLERRYGVAAALLATHLIPCFAGERTFAGGEDLVEDGVEVNHCTVIVEGFAAQYKLLSNGRRQITALSIAGDVVDLGGLFNPLTDHGVVSIGPTTVRMASHDQLRQVMSGVPEIRSAFWRHMADDAVLYREWLVSMGRRSAIEHLARLICELCSRLNFVGLATPSGFRLPLTQADLADALGLSAVHVNRIVKQLRASGVLTIVNQNVTIRNWPRLTEIAEFRNELLSLSFDDRVAID